MKMKSHSVLKTFLYITLLLIADIASAHPGHGLTHGFYQSVLHPWQGLDHMFVMVAIGLWGRALGGKAIWQVPVAFISAMAFGAALHYAGFNIMAAEHWLTLSVLLCGCLLWRNWQLPIIWASVIAAVIAVCHGYAHAVELVNSPLQFKALSGLLFSTLILISTGIALGSFGQKAGKTIRSGFGFICMATGVVLLLG
jgi:urease accessory protein